MVIISIDPGLTGACAVIAGDQLRAVFDLPRMKAPDAGENAMVQDKIDSAAFRALLKQHAPPGDERFAVIEAINVYGAVTGGSAQAQGSLTRTFGNLESVLEVMGVPIHYVQPKVWKGYYGLLDSHLRDSQRKAMSLTTARNLFPDSNSFKLAKSHNRAEAVLLGNWFRKVKLS